MTTPRVLTTSCKITRVGLTRKTTVMPVDVAVVLDVVERRRVKAEEDVANKPDVQRGAVIVQDLTAYIPLHKRYLRL